MARLNASNDFEVIVIGAGPYGLSVAAHLKARGIATHTFGEAMSFWRRHMPKGMKLRSPWRATDLSDPGKALSLDLYATSRGLPRLQPLPIDDFIGYGDWFQTNAVPDLDTRRIVRVGQAGNGFIATTADGDKMTADSVVIATGLENHQITPEAFASAPHELVSHTCEHDDLSGFAGKRVAIIGRGQSACETAALLSEAHAEAELICRGPVRWLGAGKYAAGWRKDIHSQMAAWLEAPSAIGRFPLSWGVEVPSALRLLPQETRDAFSTACLRAAAAGWLKPRFGGVRVTSGVEIVKATAKGGQMELKFDDGRIDTFDQVMLATGYKFDVANLGMLAPELRASIACRAGAPILSHGFESSMPGLFFAGASAVSSFGPLMRFIAGTSYAARGVTRGISAKRRYAGPAYKPVEYGVAT
ncbi:MAG: NAD(P)/FAD-dependent oxidoreductase [Methylobacteriaceae bacterium]|nr:NAD(P)/FAD-dependent oxidoreductase [Methylobacteriaceae bacterium]